MVSVDETKPRGAITGALQKVLKMTWFHVLVLALVLLNAVVMASMNFDPRKPEPRKRASRYYYYYAEVGFFNRFMTMSRSLLIAQQLR